MPRLSLAYVLPQVPLSFVYDTLLTDLGQRRLIISVHTGGLRTPCLILDSPASYGYFLCLTHYYVETRTTSPVLAAPFCA